MSPAFVDVIASRSAPPPSTVVPSTDRTTSPFCSFPADGDWGDSAATTTLPCTGMPSWRSAAVVALCCDCDISAALSFSACSAVSPLG